MCVFFRTHLLKLRLVRSYPLIKLRLTDNIFGPVTMLSRNERIRHKKSQIVARWCKEQPDSH
ncbi:hypothetical protein D3C74_354600 [compost metagenome]